MKRNPIARDHCIAHYGPSCVVCVEPVDPKPHSRLELGAGDFGKLSVSAQLMCKWESEKARPRAEQIAKLASLRGVGKREVAARMEKLSGAKR